MIYSYGGRYAIVIFTPELKRLYLDPGGTLATVYSGKRKKAGSTTSVILQEEYGHYLWRRDVTGFPNDRPNQFWPAGMTLDHQISRLLPNHYLDLATWRAVRHYPRTTLQTIRQKDVPEAIDKITAVLRRHIRAAVDRFQVIYMPLTAGRDSRMLLAASRPYCERLQYITFDYRHCRSELSDHIDVCISAELAKDCGLRRLLIPIRGTSPNGVEVDYLRRIGFSGGAGKSRDFFLGCKQNLDMAGAWLTGFAGEIGRAFYSRPDDQETDKATAKELLTRMNLPTETRFEQAMSAWLCGLPEHAFTTQLGFAYLEHRVGCWASPHMYGAAPFALNLMPFCHREIFDTMLRLPPEYQRGKLLPYDLISAVWPDLNKLPYNDYFGIRRLIDPRILRLRSKRMIRYTVRVMRLNACLSTFVQISTGTLRRLLPR